MPRFKIAKYEGYNKLKKTAEYKPRKKRHSILFNDWIKEESNDANFKGLYKLLRAAGLDYWQTISYIASYD